MPNELISIKVNVKCPRDSYCIRQVPLQYIPLEGDINYAATAGCDFLSGSEHCKNCVNRLLKIFTTKRDYAGETIYIYDRPNN